MKRIPVLIAAILTGSLGLTGVRAQEDPHRDHATPSSGTASEVPENGMMAAMMSEMPMMKERLETAQLVEQLAGSFAAIEAEKDPAALTQKLAVHGALLKELQTKMQAQGKKMDEMMGKMKNKMAPVADPGKKPADDHKH